MAVTYGSSKYADQGCLCSLYGTIAEVRAELAVGTAAGNYKWKGHMADLLHVGGSATDFTAIYKVDKGSGTL